MDNKDIQSLLDSLDEGPLGKPEVYWDRVNNLKLAQKIRNEVPYEQRREWAPNKGKKLTKQRKEQISNSMRKSAEKRGHLKPLVQYTLDGTLVKEWPCVKDACKELGLGAGIRATCLGRQKSAYGYVWKYLEK